MAATSGMRLRVITAVSAMALLATGSALAQTTPPAGGAGGGLGAQSATAPRPRPPAPNPLTMEDVSQIQGAAVYDSSDKKIGSVSTVLMQPSSKTIDRLVVGEGGVLGIGSHRVALPIDAFSWDAQKGGFRISKSGDDLKSMPEWKQLSEAPSGASGGMSPSGK